jgi:hypothetical protein
MDARRLLDLVRPGGTKERTTVSVDPQVLEAFRKAIDPRSVSAMVEALMGEFLHELKNPDADKVSKLPRELVARINQITSEETLGSLIEAIEAVLDHVPDQEAPKRGSSPRVRR